MKKFISCGLLLAMLGAVGTMCFAMHDNDYEMYSVYNQAALELKHVTDLNVCYRLLADKHRIDPDNKEYSALYNSVLNKVTDSCDTLIELSSEGTLDLGQRAVLDLWMLCYDRDDMANRCSKIEWDGVSRPVKSSYGGAIRFNVALMNGVRNSYEDICYSYPKHIQHMGQISQLDYEQAVLALMLEQDNFNRVADYRDKMTAEAQKLSDKLAADECIYFANAWGGDHDDSVSDTISQSSGVSPVGTCFGVSWDDLDKYFGK